LSEVAKTLNEEGVDTEIISSGKQAVQGCIACGMCGRNGNKCTFHDELYFKVMRAVKDGIDGLVIGSPVYYGGPNGSLCALLDRVFYSLGADLRFKPGASVVVCRRGGASAAFDRLNKYFTMMNMPLVTSQYWNMAYGQTPGQVAQDEEGMQTMRTLGRNMAWMIRKLNVNEEGHPELERPVRTSFIR
jgi:multimeric flavodoxin WrbA